VQLGLPVRIRWHGPAGMRLEVTQTIDVGRQGLLVRRKELCQPGARVWIAYPYDVTASPVAHTEASALVMRVERLSGDVSPASSAHTADHPAPAQSSSPRFSPDGYRVALHFRSPRASNYVYRGVERRASMRMYSAVPIFVRTASGRWPEEAMTQDLSRSGVRFETCQIYAVGDLVCAKVPWAEWARAGEIAGRVVRVEMVEDTSIPAPAAQPEMGRSAMYASVAVEWTSPPNLNRG
jgi:hypothetical protein